MLDFACPGCGRKVKVKDELAGHKGKCPHCGHALTVPTASAAALAGLADAKTPPRAASGRDRSAPEAPTAAEHRPVAAEEGRRDTRSDADATGGLAPGAGLTDFLAPPQGPGEIGRLGPYRVLKVLGAGGMGVVFQAEDPHLQRLVALKAMLPALAASASARERFLREARTAASVEHDHIVTIFQVGEDRGVPYLAMPLLKGEPLDERLKREKRLPMAEVLRVGRETAAGLEAARVRNLIHRDIKPANLWLEAETGRVKILDFGLARAADGEAGLTQQGAILGTPAYMAPEQAGGKVDHRADLFSLGCVLYRAATGELPFKGTDTISTLMAVATEHPRPPHEVYPKTPRNLSDLVMRLLAKKPEGRPSSAQAVVEAIRALEADPTIMLAPRKRPSKLDPVRPAAKPAPASKPALAAAKAAPASKPALAAAKAPPLPQAPPRKRGGGLLLGVGAAAFAAMLLGAGGYVLNHPDILHPRPAGPLPPGQEGGRPGDTNHEPPERSPDPPGYGGEVHGPGHEPLGAGLDRPAPPPALPDEVGWQPLFNGRDLTGWVVPQLGVGWRGNWGGADGVLYTRGTDQDWLLTEKEYDNFEVRLDYKLTTRANSGVGLRATTEADDALFAGLEIQLLDDPSYSFLKPTEVNGSIYGLAPAARRGAKPTGEWNHIQITAQGPLIKVDLNGDRIVDTDLDLYKDLAVKHRGLSRRKGRIGLQSHTSRVEFRNLFVRPLPSEMGGGRG